MPLNSKIQNISSRVIDKFKSISSKNEKENVTLLSYKRFPQENFTVISNSTKNNKFQNDSNIFQIAKNNNSEFKENKKMVPDEKITPKNELLKTNPTKMNFFWNTSKQIITEPNSTKRDQDPVGLIQENKKMVPDEKITPKNELLKTNPTKMNFFWNTSVTPDKKQIITEPNSTKRDQDSVGLIPENDHDNEQLNTKL